MSFQVFNVTEGMLASQRVFGSEDEARALVQRFKEGNLGRVLTLQDGRRIEAQRVRLEVQEISGH